MRRAVSIALGLTESTMRHCSIVLASDKHWYLFLADREHGEYNEATAYGPFPDEEAAHRYIRKFSNPGGSYTDKSGKQAPPKKSPNGRPVVRP